MDQYLIPTQPLPCPPPQTHHDDIRQRRHKVVPADATQTKQHFHPHATHQALLIFGKERIAPSNTTTNSVAT